MSRQQITTDSKFLKYSCNSNLPTKYFYSNSVLRIPTNIDFTLQVNSKIEILEIEIDKFSTLTILIEGQNKIYFDKTNYEMVKNQINYQISNDSKNCFTSIEFSKALIGENIILLGEDCQ